MRAHINGLRLRLQTLQGSSSRLFPPASSWLAQLHPAAKPCSSTLACVAPPPNTRVSPGTLWQEYIAASVSDAIHPSGFLAAPSFQQRQNSSNSSGQLH